MILELTYQHSAMYPEQHAPSRAAAAVRARMLLPDDTELTQSSIEATALEMAQRPILVDQRCIDIEAAYSRQRQAEGWPHGLSVWITNGLALAG